MPDTGAEIVDLRDLRAKRDPFLRCLAARRHHANDRVLAFMFDRAPTDDELRFLNEVMRRAAVMMNTGGGK